MKRQFTYDLEQGRVYVVIESADVDKRRDWDKGVDLEVHVPQVLVSTKPVFADDGTYLPDVPWGYLKVGNYRYSVLDRYRPTSEQEKAQWNPGMDGGPAPWTTGGLHTPYGDGGILRDSGTQVAYDSPVLKKIKPVIMAALERFAEEVPNWDHQSIALHLKSERDRAETKLDDARAEVEKAGNAADKAQAVLTEYLAKHGLEVME